MLLLWRWLKRSYARRAVAGPPEPSEITHQQRLEQLKHLADIFVDIFGSLTPEQRIIYMSQDVTENAA
jgi:hypothetical protein